MAKPEPRHSGTPSDTPSYGSEGGSIRREKSFVEEAADSVYRNFATYNAFMLVGCGCGWLASDSIDQLLANEHAVQRHGAMFGILSKTSGIVGLGSGLLFLMYLFIFRKKPSLGQDQYTCVLLTMCNIATLSWLALFWQSGAPQYPVVVVCNIVGVLTAQATYYFIFPLIATFYAGWLTAPVRTGTDLSTLVTALLGEVQNPTGQQLNFSSAYFFSFLVIIASLGLVAWFVIIKHDIGLKKKALQDDAAADSSGLEHTGLQLGCPRELLMVMVLTVAAGVMQWGFVGIVGNVGALMTDPGGCNGTQGSSVYRSALTWNRVLVPIGSLLSSFGECPKCLFYMLGALQIILAALVCTTILGVFRYFWASPVGQLVYVLCFGCIGGLESYLMTMAYRYSAEEKYFTTDQRRCTSNLLSLLCVVVINLVSILVGRLVENGTIHCSA